MGRNPNVYGNDHSNDIYLFSSIIVFSLFFRVEYQPDYRSLNRSREQRKHPSEANGNVKRGTGETDVLEFKKQHSICFDIQAL